ncbi:hypothetical protein LT493_02390 [Streptomyces tricolor]|nr:hypothetical protein [Streptomyces tricolor]
MLRPAGRKPFAAKGRIGRGGVRPRADSRRDDDGPELIEELFERAPGRVLHAHACC